MYEINSIANTQLEYLKRKYPQIKSFAIKKRYSKKNHETILYLYTYLKHGNLIKTYLNEEKQLYCSSYYSKNYSYIDYYTNTIVKAIKAGLERNKAQG